MPDPRPNDLAYPSRSRCIQSNKASSAQKGDFDHSARKHGAYWPEPRKWFTRPRTAVPRQWTSDFVTEPDKSGTGVSEMATESLRRNQSGKAHTRIRAAHPHAGVAQW